MFFQALFGGKYFALNCNLHIFVLEVTIVFNSQLLFAFCSNSPASIGVTVYIVPRHFIYDTEVLTFSLEVLTLVKLNLKHLLMPLNQTVWQEVEWQLPREGLGSDFMGSSCNLGATLHGSGLVLAYACLLHENFSSNPCVGPLLSEMVLEGDTKILKSFDCAFVGVFVGFISRSGLPQAKWKVDQSNLTFAYELWMAFVKLSKV